MIKRLLFLTALTIAVGSVNAQGLTTFYMDMIPQSNRSNVGMMPKPKFYLGLPLISCLDFSLVNNGFVLSDLFSGGGSGTTITTDKMLSKLRNDNYISMNTAWDYLSFGFKVGKKKKTYMSLNVTEKIAFNFDYSKEFMTLLAKGTAPFIGSSASMLGTGFRFTHYREYGLGFNQLFLKDKLSVGFKVKFLQGLSHINSEELNISLATNPDDYSLTATSTLGLRTAGLSFLTDSSATFSPGSYLTNFENVGAAFDLGGEYKVNDKITATLSVADLGVIKWKTDARRYYNNKAEFTWTGLDLMQFLNKKTSSKYTKNLSDSLTNIFGLKRQDYTFSTNLIGNMYVGGKYKLNKTFDVGAIFHGQLFAGNLYPSYTALAGINLGKMVQASLSYSVLNRSYSNIGAGLALNLGALQLYFVGDNILGFTQLDYAKTLNVRLGINIVMGYSKKMSKEEKKQEKIKRTLSKKDTDKDGVNDYDDKCLETPGLAQFKGCPDKDNDGVADNEDICPTEAGTPETGGCPDTDNDGVADRTDECPSQYGRLKGCPDADNDSIKDSEDACPQIPGKKEFKGCPDRDKDGISDADDKCPDFKGSAAHQGCPDSDGDGVFDNEDKCISEPGTAELFGCTSKDTDGDTLPDVLDKCPYRVGSAENGGCPVE